MSGHPAAPHWPHDLRETMARIGPVWHTDVDAHVAQMLQAFSAILAQHPPPAGMLVHRNLAYGGHPRQVLDLYAPEAPNGAAVVFIHGGAFTTGQRAPTPQVYANVLTYLARHGVVGINGEYRLAPEAVWPGATEDVAAMVAWLRQSADAWGVDPDRVYLMGHSAGAAHAASYAYDRRFHPSSGSGLAGLMVASGRVRADARPENPNAARVRTYYGNDETLFEDRSGISHVDADSVQTFITWAQYENPLLDTYSMELAERLAAAQGRPPPTLYLPGHNHTSLIAHIDTAEDTLGRAMLAFMGVTPS